MLERLSLEMGTSRGTRLGRCPYCNCCKKCAARQRSKSKEKVGLKARSKSSVELAAPNFNDCRPDSSRESSQIKSKPRRDWEEPLTALAAKMKSGKAPALKSQEAKRLSDPGKPQPGRPRVRRRGQSGLEDPRRDTKEI